MSFLSQIINDMNKHVEENGQPYIEEDYKNSPLEIILKPEILDTSNIKEGEGNISFRPTKFNEYIGQQKAKQRALCYIEGCKKYNDHFPNTFISAPAGCGKTLFANILSNLLGKKFVTCTAGEIKSEQQLVNKIVECEGGILFLDEAHRINNKIGTFLLPILEEYKITGKSIKPFTMITATTHKGNLAENLSALIQRFPLQIELENYDDEELSQIFEQYISKEYTNETISSDILLQIAENCRDVPRIGLSLLREYVYIKDWKQVKDNNNIIQDGFTQQDIKLLIYINNIGGASKSSLAKYLRVEPKTYEYEIEPFLINQETITISNKRKITDKGKELLQCIQ